MRVIHFGLFLVAVAACGGKLDTDEDAGNPPDGSTPPKDAQTGKDAQTVKDSAPAIDVISPPPPPPQCTPIMSSGTVGSDGSCSTNANWSCDATKYTVDCSCPKATCTCSQETANGGSGTTVPAPAFCPKCGMPASELAALCGFPSN